MTAETDIAAIDDAGWNTAAEVRTALTSVLARADLAPDHGALSGLGDDDHTQYHTDARGDARYSLLAHTHSYLPLSGGTITNGTHTFTVTPGSANSQLILFDDNPQVWFKEDGRTAGGKSYWFHLNDGIFYILGDFAATGSPTEGNWGSERPFRIDASANVVVNKLKCDDDVLYMGSGDDYLQYNDSGNYFRLVIDSDEAFRFTQESNNTFFDLMDTGASYIRKTEGTSLQIVNEVANQDIYIKTDNGSGAKNRVFIDGSTNTINFYNHDGSITQVLSSELIYSRDLGAGIWGGFKSDTAGTNRLYFYINSSNYYLMTTGAFAPATDNARDLGASTLRWDDVYATNGTIQTSDPRMKRNLRNSDLGLDFIMRLEPAAWEFLDGRRPHYGLDAGQVQRVLAELGQDFAGLIDPSYGGKVELNEDGSIKYDEDGQPATDHDPEGPLGLRYTEFVGPIVKALQELNEKIERRAA